MNIRRAQEKDIPRLIELLEQVLLIHADIRPDIFIPGTTKYTNEELAMLPICGRAMQPIPREEEC